MKQVMQANSKPSKKNIAMRDLVTSEVFGDGDFWPKGLTPFSFQLDALPFIFQRDNVYIAYDPGLGKTIVARLVQNWLASRNVRHIAHVIVPPFLSANTETEFKKWGFKADKEPFRIFRDSKLNDVLTYDDAMRDLARFKNDLKILIVDEAHRYKNEKAARSIALYALAKHYDKVIFMSGTPLPNSRPIEIWPILKRFAPDVFGTNFMQFARRYCGAHKNDYDKWVFDRMTNRKEFYARITKSFMLRLKKREALPDMPERIVSMLTVGEGMPPLIGKLERKLLSRYSEQDLIEGKISAKVGKDDLHMSEYFRHLGSLKLELAYPFIQLLLEETNENLLILAHHKEVISQLLILLHQYRPLSLAVPAKDRQAVVDKYQRSKDRRVLVGNLLASGVGLTITKADRVLILEPSWRPGDNDQAIDRAHRIGREGSVIAQYCVLKDSLDAKRMAVVMNKELNAI